MGDEEGTLAIEDYVEHLPLRVPPDEVHAMVEYLLEEHPVVHSDADGGFWVVNRHADLLKVMQDWRTFENGNPGVRIPHDPQGVNRPPMPPIDSNPPLHRQVREVMNPFFAPAALAKWEGRIREIIGGLIAEFAGDGRADIAIQLAKKFPSQITAETLLGVTDPDQLENLRIWNRRLSYDLLTEDPKVLAAVQVEFSKWSHALVDKRKSEPGDDVVSALVQATVDGERLVSDEEVVGAIQIVVAGGFSTTADATCNIVVRLIEDPELEPLLRAHPELIPAAVEEILRLDPPVMNRPRKCTRDTGGTVIPANDRVLCNYVAANVDPLEWVDADEFKIDRTRNRVMTFGAGPHRCIGSNMARLSLRIMVEELLLRVTAIRYADEIGARRISTQPGGWRMVDGLPVTFSPVASDGAADSGASD